MFQQKGIQDELRKLGIRTPVPEVREAVQRLKNGDSVYSLYQGANSFLAKATATKLKKLLQEGKLDFILQALISVDEAEDAAKTAKEAGGPSPYEDRFPESVPRAMDKLTSFIARVLELVPKLPKFDWNVDYLESVGIPVNTALDMIVECTELSSKAALGKWSMADFVRYVELHHYVSWRAQDLNRTHTAPHEIISLAARSYAKGDVDNNEYLRSVGRDIMRFQVWRGPEFLAAFNKVQAPTIELRDKRRPQWERELKSVLAIEQLAKSAPR